MSKRGFSGYTAKPALWSQDQNAGVQQVRGTAQGSRPGAAMPIVRALLQVSPQHRSTAHSLQHQQQHFVINLCRYRGLCQGLFRELGYVHSLHHPQLLAEQRRCLERAFVGPTLPAKVTKTEQPAPRCSTLASVPKVQWLIQKCVKPLKLELSRSAAQVAALATTVSTLQEESSAAHTALNHQSKALTQAKVERGKLQRELMALQAKEKDHNGSLGMQTRRVATTELQMLRLRTQQLGQLTPTPITPRAL